MKRVKWIDVAKYFGMFFIYLGHFGTVAGKAYPWVFSFHVAFFFFLSGCVENYNKKNMIENIWNKIVTLVIPFFFFGILSLIIRAINLDSLENIRENLLVLIKGGIRNQINVGAALWFFTCLFVVEMMFMVIKKIKCKPLILVVCFGIFLCSKFIVSPNGIAETHLYWNIENAFYYIIFYGIGYVTYNSINAVFVSEKKIVKYGYRAIVTFCLAFSALLFFGKDIFAPVYSINRVFGALGNIITPMINIVLMTAVSHWLSENKFLNDIGKNSLYLCGNEYIVKTLVPVCLSMIGLTLTVSTPLQAYFYTFVLLILVDKIITPLEKKILGTIQKDLLQWRKNVR